MKREFLQKLMKRERMLLDRAEKDHAFGASELEEVLSLATSMDSLQNVDPRKFNAAWARMIHDASAFYPDLIMPELLSPRELIICREMCRRHHGGKITDELLGFPPEEFEIMEKVFNVDLKSEVISFLYSTDSIGLELAKFDKLLDSVNPYDFLVWGVESGVDIPATSMAIAEEIS